MTGVLNWHRSTRRYDEDMLLKSPTIGRVLYGPTGLGTSAGRIASRSGAASRKSTSVVEQLRTWRGSP
jgi:germacradienol/geosmin synthase